MTMSFLPSQVNLWTETSLYGLALIRLPSERGRRNVRRSHGKEN